MNDNELKNLNSWTSDSYKKIKTKGRNSIEKKLEKKDMVRLCTCQFIQHQDQDLCTTNHCSTQNKPCRLRLGGSAIHAILYSSRQENIDKFHRK